MPEAKVKPLADDEAEGATPPAEQEYRLFYVNEKGRIARSHEFLAANDLEARQRAVGFWAEDSTRFPSVELWQRARKVLTWP